MNRKSIIDGYWEEGYHYYLEIRGSVATLRDYNKSIIFKTSLKYDRELLAQGKKTELILGETVLSRSADGEPMTWIKNLYYEKGEIVMDYYYTIMGDTTYILKKVSDGPFDNILILDKKILPKIQGEWLEYYVNGENSDGTGLRIKKNVLKYGTKDFSFFESKIHAIAYKTNPDNISIVPEDLTVHDFGHLTSIQYREDMLSARRIIFDASSPLIVFMRKESFGKVPVPPEAFEKSVNYMEIARNQNDDE